MSDRLVTTTEWRKAADLLYEAWVVIANANGGDWQAASADWREAAERWRDRYHETLRVTEDQPAPQGEHLIGADMRKHAAASRTDTSTQAVARRTACVSSTPGGLVTTTETPLDLDAITRLWSQWPWDGLTEKPTVDALVAEVRRLRARVETHHCGGRAAAGE